MYHILNMICVFEEDMCLCVQLSPFCLVASPNLAGQFPPYDVVAISELS